MLKIEIERFSFYDCIFKFNYLIMIAKSEMEEIKRYLPPKRELTPKINHTKTTIAKSVPFLITKHHLDDTQMKRALHYDDQTIKDNRNRRYSYKGDVVSCQNSKISTKIYPYAQNPNHKLKLKSTSNEVDDYYTKNNTTEEQKNVQMREDNNKKQQKPYFTNSGVREARSDTIIPNNQYQHNTHQQNSNRKSYLMVRQCQEYGLEQMHAARKKMQRQAKKLRKLHKKQVEKDINNKEQSQIVKLEEEIKNLKIKTLESQKQKYMRQLYERKRQQQQIKQKITSNQALKINRAKLILNKPKYKRTMTKDDTDSSFSSFQLS